MTTMTDNNSVTSLQCSSHSTFMTRQTWAL